MQSTYRCKVNSINSSVTKRSPTVPPRSPRYNYEIICTVAELLVLLVLSRFHQHLPHNLSSSSCFLKIRFAIITLFLLLSFLAPVFNPLPIFLYSYSNSVHIQLWSSYFGSYCDCFCICPLLQICQPPPSNQLALPSPIFPLGCVAIRPLSLGRSSFVCPPSLSCSLNPVHLI